MSQATVTRPDPDPALEPSLHPQAAPGNAQTQSLARIAIVDQEPLDSADLEDFLGSLGYRQVVSVAPDAHTLAVLRDERPDLVLLGVSLRRPGAFELLSAMGADRLLRHVPVIATAEQEERPARLRALELGASHYLVKPIDPADFRLRLRNTLALKFRHDRLVYTDNLTGLPNKEASLRQLEWALHFARRHETIGAVLQVGLDRFRQINETLGPALGDVLLRAVGWRLAGCLRGTDIVTRDGSPEAAAQLTRADGDEFTVLLPAMARRHHASVVAQRIVAAMAEPFRVAGHEQVVTCQVGVAVFPDDTIDKDTILRRAKLAMHDSRAACAATGSGIRFYSKDLNSRSMDRMKVERDLHHALKHDELLLYFQPKVDVVSGRIAGAEALVRWQHPQRGLLGPGAFLEVSEESGLIVPLGDRVLREALRHVALWRQDGLPALTVNVNVSVLQLRRPEFESTVREALSDAGLDGTSLCIEVTESVLMDTGGHVLATLHALKELGVRLSLDDFGTGYSSFSYLQRLPIDELKIDRSFVSECRVGQGTAGVITGAIVTMAHALRLEVVAEGVETEQQLGFIRNSGCDYYQGYLYSRPLPASEFKVLLQKPDM